MLHSHGSFHTSYKRLAPPTPCSVLVQNEPEYGAFRRENICISQSKRHSNSLMDWTGMSKMTNYTHKHSSGTDLDANSTQSGTWKGSFAYCSLSVPRWSQYHENDEQIFIFKYCTALQRSAWLCCASHRHIRCVCVFLCVSCEGGWCNHDRRTELKAPGRRWKA